MLSDLSRSMLSLDTPIYPNPGAPHLEGIPFAPLGFDDLLDMAREFEFARAITHIWSSDEESNACPATGLDGILAMIATTSNSEECPLPLLSPAESTAIQPMIHIQEPDSHRSTSACSVLDINDRIPADPDSAPKDDRVRADTVASIASALQGWAPPNGSQFLDLDDSLMLSQSVWSSSWLAASVPSAGENQLFVTTAIEPEKAQNPPSVDSPNEIAGSPMEKTAPTAVQPSPRAILGPVRARPTAQWNSKASNRTAMTPKAKQPRPHTTSAGIPNYARPPKGGIPPHIARSVTKANILRVEKERKMMQGAFSSTPTAEAKKPSVLRRTSKVEKEAGRNINAACSGKQPSDSDENGENERRAAKRARF